MIKLDTSADSRWNMALDQLVGPMETAKPKAPKAIREPKPKTEAQIKAANRRNFWRSAARVLKSIGNFLKSIGNFLSNRARDLGLIAIVIGTGVAVFQGSLTSATLFGFSSWSAYAFAIMPDALMVISASKMRGVGVSPVQRREAKISMYFGLTFSLVSNMIAAMYITMPQAFTSDIRTGGAVAYHAIIVLFLWRAVETTTKTRAEAPSVRRNAKARKAIQVPKQVQR